MPTNPVPPTEQEITENDFLSSWKIFAIGLYAKGKASGFYDTPHTDPRFNHEQKLILMVSEIIEGLEGTRGAPWPGIPDDKLPHRPMLEVELADAVIRIMNYASHCGLNVADAIVEKARFNATRGFKLTKREREDQGAEFDWEVDSPAALEVKLTA